MQLYCSMFQVNTLGTVLLQAVELYQEYEAGWMVSEMV